MAEAKHALEVLSREPSAQRIAEMRREAEIARRLDRAEDLAEGRAEGRAEGLAEGRALAARANIASLCRALGIELDEQRRAWLEAANDAALQALFDTLLAQRAWPES